MAQDSAEALPAAATPYESDPYTWALEQVVLLKAGRFSELDVANLAEELSDVARSEYRALESALTVLIQHLLKWHYQPERRSRSWVLTIQEQRDRVVDILDECPGLKSRTSDALTRGFRYGRSRALGEMQAPDAALPKTCPFQWDDVMEQPIVLDAENG